MDSNPILHAAMMESIENQIRNNDPPETKKTLDRLMTQGHSKQDAMNLIGTVLAAEMYEILRHNRPYDAKRYIEELNRLPRAPFDEQK